MLHGLSLGRTTMRAATIRAPLQFRRSGQPLFENLPKRPTRPIKHLPRGSGELCLQIDADVPAVQVATAYPLLRISDYSPVNERRIHRQKHNQRVEAWIRAGRKGFRPKYSPLPTVKIGPPMSCGGVDRRYVQTPINQNIGAYRRCLLDATKRGTPPHGLVTIEGTIDLAGNVSATALATTTSDPVLIECLRRSVESVWFDPLPTTSCSKARSLAFQLPLRLTPIRPPKASNPKSSRSRSVDYRAREARRKLQRGNGQEALAAYLDLLDRYPEHVDTLGCLPQSCK